MQDMDPLHTISLLIISTAIAYIFLWISNRWKKLNVFRGLGIPGPSPSLLSGNAFEYLPDPIGILTKWKNKYGDTFGYFYGSQPYLVISDRSMIKTVLKEKFDNFCNRPKMCVPIEPLASGVVYAENPLWSSLRKPLSCAMTGSKIKLMGDSINSSIDEFLAVISEEGEKPFDIYQHSQGLTMSVISRCALAMEVDCVRNPQETILVSTKEFMKNGINVAVKLAIMFPSLGNIMVWLYDNLPAGKVSNIVCDHLTKVLAYRRNLDGPKRFDMLQMLIDAKDSSGNGLSDTEIIGSCFAFVVAGYETTSNTLAYTFYLLAKHPDIQEALAEEVGSFGERPTYDEISQCQLLNQVVRESLRMYPPVVTFVTRIATDHTELGNYTIPAGMAVMIPVYQLHHDENLWPDPDKFDPSRFSPDNADRIDPMSFLPFGDGRRNCLGERFALFEAKMAVARTVKKFSLCLCSETEDPIKIAVPTVTANPKNGVIIRAIPRH